jgi:hypothetical protein
VARKLTAELLTAVADATERGASAREIAAAVGISERSVVVARAKLREQGRLPAYAPPSSAWEAARAVAATVEAEPAPAAAVERLRTAEVKDALLASVLRASRDGSWRASTWLLQQLWPDEFGTRVPAPPTEAPNGIDPETGLPDVRYLRVVK